MLICISRKVLCVIDELSQFVGAVSIRVSLAEEDASEDQGSKYDHCYRGI